MYLNAQTGDLYNAPLGGVVGDREATVDELLAWQQARVTPDAVKTECARRIYAACSQASQNNINAYMNMMSVGLVVHSDADIALFGKGMAWINAMRGACAGLVGKTTYTDDASWPALPDDVAAFAARF